ncbi:MAG: hypothetical protein DIZ80_06565 [endosymbiont of Galathealinum brachiosum]|uniref:Uncharacterized protein n=1 Tax=endosymbiont of Galathealinum brachiosum TaxID=2200906 RepID=A0A370DI05_9GAMM|nr:MAG: hypothetical protein DIZ80_06565 [endosymbiont of Galathealinum brachiosum]
MRPLIYSVILYSFFLSVNAQPLYLKQFNNSKVDDKKIEEAHKQIKEHSEIEVKDNLFVQSFHKQNSKIETDKHSFCISCHQQKPHKLNKRKRSFLNMHSDYISCETCHFVPKNTLLTYEWFNFNNDSNKVSANRIVPLFNNKPVILLDNHELALKIKKEWKNKPSFEKAGLKYRLHTPLSKKGPDCMGCHNNKDQLIDLVPLGFKEKEIKKLQQHSIPRFFSRFTKDDQRLRMTDLLQ